MKYKIGQKFLLWADNFSPATYLLCRTEKNILGLINIETGVNWADGVFYDDSKDITHQQMSDLFVEDNWEEIFRLVE